MHSIVFFRCRSFCFRLAANGRPYAVGSSPARQGPKTRLIQKTDNPLRPLSVKRASPKWVIVFGGMILYRDIRPAIGKGRVSCSAMLPG